MKQGEDIEAVDENGLVTTARIKSLTADEILAGFYSVNRPARNFRIRSLCSWVFRNSIKWS